MPTSLLAATLAFQATSVIGADAHLTTPIANLANTNATAAVVSVSTAGFSRARRVQIRRTSTETNATQLTIGNTANVRKGDVLMATFAIRGQAVSGKPAQIEFMFERASSPWTKSVTQSATTYDSPSQWRTIQVPFVSIEDYAPGQAMASFRLAFGPQTIELGGVRIVNYRNTRTLEQLQTQALTANPLGKVSVSIPWGKVRQTMRGFGGNFCQPRYGSTSAMDSVGTYVLNNLKVTDARIGIPLNDFSPSEGNFNVGGTVRASYEAMRIFKQRKMPIVASVWEPPRWLTGGNREQNGTSIPPEMLDSFIRIVGAYLQTSKTEYGVEPEYFSFNEPDLGINVKLTAGEMVEFIRRAKAEFQRRGLKTRFIVADTANGTNLYDYARPTLEAKDIQSVLGPIAFHSWDALSASDEAYTRIAELARKHKRPVWCLEAGHDPQLWQKPNPWASWDNAFRLAMAYERTLRLTEAELMSYWTYQDNYPLVDGKTNRPYAAFHVMKQMEGVFAKGAKVVRPDRLPNELRILGTSGPKRNQRNFLAINPIGAGEVTVSGLPAGAVARIETRRGTGAPAVSQIRVDRSGRLTFPAPARSVTTATIGG